MSPSWQICNHSRIPWSGPSHLPASPGIPILLKLVTTSFDDWYDTTNINSNTTLHYCTTPTATIPHLPSTGNNPSSPSTYKSHLLLHSPTTHHTHMILHLKSPFIQKCSEETRSPFAIIGTSPSSLNYDSVSLNNWKQIVSAWTFLSAFIQSLPSPPRNSHIPFIAEYLLVNNSFSGYGQK